MKPNLTSDDFIAILNKVADDLTAAADRLRELDAAIGDGDLGITVTLGFQAVRETLPTLAGCDIGTLLMKSGMAFNRKAASTFGALFATMMLSAAKIARGLHTVDVAQMAAMFAAAVVGVRERGKADLGDKTLLDALVPASEALAAASAENASLSDALERAKAAAEKGMLATVQMKSQAGRSSWFADRTHGIQDPGATAVYLMICSLSEYIGAATAEG